jgi:hypothetical protein
VCCAVFERGVLFCVISIFLRVVFYCRIQEYGRRDPRLIKWHSLSAKVSQSSTTSGGRSVGIVRSQTKAKKFFVINKNVSY